MTSNMTYIVALGVGLKCPCKIHLNTHCPPPGFSDLATALHYIFIWKCHFFWFSKPQGAFNLLDLKLGLMSLTIVAHILVRLLASSKLLADIVQSTYSYGNVTFLVQQTIRGFQFVERKIGPNSPSHCTYLSKLDL